MLNSKYPPEWSQFDIMWSEASEEQKDIIRAQYSELQKKDWRTLSIEQLQNCYTITYGCPESEVFRKRDKVLVFLGTSAAIASGVGLYYFLRLFAKPPPATDTDPEYLAAAKKKMDRHIGHNLYDLETYKDDDNV